MNHQESLVIETVAVWVKIRPPHFASDARSQVHSTFETSRNGSCRLNKRGLRLPTLAPWARHQPVRGVRGRSTVGFSEAWRRRSIVLQKRRPWRAEWSPGSGASSTRPRPGYPLLVCSPAWPNSVSPGTVNDNLRSACWLKIDKSASRMAVKNLVQ